MDNRGYIPSLRDVKGVMHEIRRIKRDLARLMTELDCLLSVVKDLKPEDLKPPEKKES